MSKMKAGYIGFMAFDEKDPYSIIEKYSKLGYSGFEFGQMLLQGDPAENLKRVKSFGMEPLCMPFFKRGDEKPDLATIAKNAHTLGVNRVSTFVGVVANYRFRQIDAPPTYDDVMREIEEFEAIATELKKEDIRFTFHNHDVEFTSTYKGVPAIYLMAANSDNLRFEIDCGWATYAGYDPLQVLDALGDKVTDIHIKDFTAGEVIQTRPNGDVSFPRFTTPGTGVLDLAGCLEKAQKMGIEWAIVEQDFQYNLSMEETLAAAYLNMKETGFVE